MFDIKIDGEKMDLNNPLVKEMIISTIEHPEVDCFCCGRIIKDGKQTNDNRYTICQCGCNKMKYRCNNNNNKLLIIFSMLIFSIITYYIMI